MAYKPLSQENSTEDLSVLIQTKDTCVQTYPKITIILCKDCAEMAEARINLSVMEICIAMCEVCVNMNPNVMLN